MFYIYTVPSIFYVTLIIFSLRLNFLNDQQFKCNSLNDFLKDLYLTNDIIRTEKSKIKRFFFYSDLFLPNI